MFFLKTTIYNIDKYKEKGKISKIIVALKNKNTQLALYAFSALDELDEIDVHIEEILDNLMGVKNDEIEQTMKRYIDANPVLVDSIIDFIIRDLSSTTLSREEINMRINNYEKYIENYMGDKTPYLIDLLENKNIYVRIYSAEKLQAINEKKSYNSWKNIIDNDKYILEKKLMFNHYLLRQPLMGEVPLYEIYYLQIMKNKTFCAYDYYLGMTDERLYIVPNISGTGDSGANYILDLKDEVECIGKSYNDISIHCVNPQLDPRTLCDNTNILNFNLNAESPYARRMSYMISLIKVLKNENLSKREIYEKYYSENNLGHHIDK